MLFIVLAMLLYTATIMLGTAASRNASTVLVSVIMTAVSAIVPLLISVPILQKKDFHGHRFGIIMAGLGGITIALFTLAINRSYEINKVGVVAPVVFGGAIVLSTLLGYFIFKEKISVVELVGLLITIAIGFGIIIYSRATS